MTQVSTDHHVALLGLHPFSLFLLLVGLHVRLHVAAEGESLEALAALVRLLT